MENSVKQYFRALVYILLSLFIFSSQVSMTQAESNTVQSFDPKTYDELFEFYQKNGSTKFDSFHHEYLMMYSLGFPNLLKHTRSAQKFGMDVDAVDFSNPQYVLKNKDRIFEMGMSIDKEFMPDHEKGVFRNPIPEGADALYKKNGYYKYYKKIFSDKEATSKKEICLKIEFIDDGVKLLDLSDEEFDNMLESSYLSVLTPILTKPKAKALYHDLINYQCFGLVIDESQLDYLYSHPKVVEIYPPKLEYFIPPPVKGR